MNEKIKLMLSYLNAEHIYVSRQKAEAAITKWSAKYPNLDSHSIVALAISDPQEINLTDKEIREIRNFYFPPKDFIERSCYF